MPTASSDSLARRGFSRSASSTYYCEYAFVVLTCEKPRRASVSSLSLRDSLIIRASLWPNYEAPRALSDPGPGRRGFPVVARSRQDRAHNRRAHFSTADENAAHRRVLRPGG